MANCKTSAIAHAAIILPTIASPLRAMLVDFDASPSPNISNVSFASAEPSSLDAATSRSLAIVNSSVALVTPVFANFSFTLESNSLLDASINASLAAI